MMTLSRQWVPGEQALNGGPELMDVEIMTTTREDQSKGEDVATKQAVAQIYWQILARITNFLEA